MASHGDAMTTIVWGHYFGILGLLPVAEATNHLNPCWQAGVFLSRLEVAALFSRTAVAMIGRRLPNHD
jgi:hypothetical protein